MFQRHPSHFHNITHANYSSFSSAKPSAPIFHRSLSIFSGISPLFLALHPRIYLNTVLFPLSSTKIRTEYKSSFTTARVMLLASLQTL